MILLNHRRTEVHKKTSKAKLITSVDSFICCLLLPTKIHTFKLLNEHISIIVSS